MSFPRADLPWIAPFAMAGLFAAWLALPPRAAILSGYLSGIVFFSLNFSWFGETAGALLGPFGFILDAGPAFIEATAFACAAGIASIAARRLHAAWIPIVCAAGFTVAEWLRSIGLFGAPLYQIGTPFVATPLAPLAAFGGGNALTFAVALLGAALGSYALERTRERAIVFGAVVAGISLATMLAWFAWPARTLGPATLRVAAVQGNITQSVKWNADALPLAVHRYTTLTAGLQAFRPQFVLWPETVITTDLLLDPALQNEPANAGLAAHDRALLAQFGALARDIKSVIAVGSIEVASPDVEYNDLIFIDATGRVEGAYRKQQLVPFAEFLPGPAWLRSLPFASLVSQFSTGNSVVPFDSKLRVAPLICWESAFADLAQTQAANGAQLYAVATDDAWFGASDGPFAHAQVSQQRAIETGRWVVRAAATGISGIIAPDGTWHERSTLNREEVITGTIGAPQPTFFSRFGPSPVALAFALLALAGFVFGRRRTA